MDNIRAVRAFVAVCDTGSFTKAADHLHTGVSTISRLINELETKLGEPLLLRSTRNVQISSEGVRRLDDCRRILASVDAIFAPKSEKACDIQGGVKVSTAPSYAKKRLIPLLPEFLDRYPGVSIEWQLTDHRSDLSGQGVDMSIRIANLDDSSMVARRLSTVDLYLVAAPALLEREGMPQVPHDIAQMTCTPSATPHFRNRWPLQPDAVVNGPVWVDDGEASREAAIAGLGVAFLPDFMVEEAIANGKLVHLFPEKQFVTLDVAILYPGRRQISAAASVFGEFLAERLKNGIYERQSS